MESSPIFAPGIEAMNSIQRFIRFPIRISNLLKSPAITPIVMNGIEITKSAIIPLSKGIANKFVIKE